MPIPPSVSGSVCHQMRRDGSCRGERSGGGGRWRGRIVYSLSCPPPSISYIFRLVAGGGEGGRLHVTGSFFWATERVCYTRHTWHTVQAVLSFSCLCSWEERSGGGGDRSLPRISSPRLDELAFSFSSFLPQMPSPREGFSAPPPGRKETSPLTEMLDEQAGIRGRRGREA